MHSDNGDCIVGDGVRLVERDVLLDRQLELGFLAALNAVMIFADVLAGQNMFHDPKGCHCVDEMRNVVAIVRFQQRLRSADAATSVGGAEDWGQNIPRLGKDRCRHLLGRRPFTLDRGTNGVIYTLQFLHQPNAPFQPT